MFLIEEYIVPITIFPHYNNFGIIWIGNYNTLDICYSCIIARESVKSLVVLCLSKWASWLVFFVVYFFVKKFFVKENFFVKKNRHCRFSEIAYILFFAFTAASLLSWFSGCWFLCRSFFCYWFFLCYHVWVIIRE